MKQRGAKVFPWFGGCKEQNWNFSVTKKVYVGLVEDDKNDGL